MLIAITLGTVFFWFDLPWLVLASVGLLLIGALTGVIMSRAGYGVGGDKYTPRAHS
jgi:hypothetical protein